MLKVSPRTAIAVGTGRQDNKGEEFKELHEYEKLLIASYIGLQCDISVDIMRITTWTGLPWETPADCNSPGHSWQCEGLDSSRKSGD